MKKGMEAVGIKRITAAAKAAKMPVDDFVELALRWWVGATEIDPVFTMTDGKYFLESKRAKKSNVVLHPFMARIFTIEQIRAAKKKK